MAVTQRHVLTQIIGFICGRIVAGTYEFEVDIIDYAMGAEGWKIVFYDRHDKTQKMGELSSDIGDGVVGGIEFDLVETGCGDFELIFLQDPASLAFTIEYNQGIEIYLYHDTNPWYAGYITEMPVSGSTERPWEIKGSGYFNQLETCIVNVSFTNTEISDIVRSVMNTTVKEKTDVLYTDYKILETDYIVVDTNFDYISAKKAIGQMKDLAQNFVCGVDEKRELFFWSRDPYANPLAIFAVGKTIDKFKIEEDASDLVNQVYVKCGLLSGDPQTNVQAAVADYVSQWQYGLREKVLTAPSLKSADDAARWGRWKVDNLKLPKKKAKLPWVDCSGGPIKATGKARIFDIDGTKHEMAIEKAKYSIDDSGIKCSLSLGKIEVGMSTLLRDTLFAAANEELLQQQNMTQVS